MKVKKWFIVNAVSLAVASFLVLACTEQASEETRKAANGTYADLQKEKQEFESAMETKVADLNRELAVLKGKAEMATGEAKEEWQKQVDELDKHLTVAQNKLKEVKNASADNWKEVKADVETTFDDLGKSFALTAERFK
ncbi:hypothetical protein KJ068_03865 [bacterium]|nr:hypothetical protein [bacterium]